jgi:hypothetical protein
MTGYSEALAKEPASNVTVLRKPFGQRDAVAALMEAQRRSAADSNGKVVPFSRAFPPRD